MKCAKCQFENPEGLIFCGQCGAKLERICPNCNLPNPLDFKFCGGCGQKLILPSRLTPKELSFDEKLAKIQRYLPDGLTEKILSQKGKIEGERKHVTIMFCDMMGFTKLTDKLGPEETFSLMDQIYEILFHKVNEYQGTVNELRGDGILALFGAPIALEDAPQRAIQSALAIHQEMIQFNENLGDNSKAHPILFRIGINTGPVVVGTVGNDLRVQFTAMGDTINMASRMETIAEPGTTYVTEETYRLTKDLFHFQPLGKKRVKGKEEPIPVYQVLPAKDAVYRPRLGSERMIYSEMVGREKELNKLELQVMMAINGQGSVVNIIGEAGIGKSRLVAELKKHEVVKRVSLLEGRAISIGRNLSYYPIIDLLKQWAEIRADDGEAAALGKLEAAVRSLFPEEVGEVLPFVATLMGMNLWGRYAERIKGIEGEALEKLILKNVRELLIRATERTPLVIVTEDLHWADTSSIELMESLFYLAGTHRILFVNVFRPGHKETGDRIAVTTKERLPARCVEIVLEPLDERMSKALISNMLNVGGLHHAVIWQIVQRAGGNPFFIEEVVRSFIDEGVVVLKNGTFQGTEKIGTIAIPNSINGVLMARIDRLPEKTRNLVKVASVIGRSFFYRVLSDVASEVEDIEGRLSYLTEIQLMQKSRRKGEVEYLFKHALAQEAAYNSLLNPNRRELHLRVAHSIEKIFSERLPEFYGMLAYHYSLAEDREKTEEFLIKAGEEALRSAASDEALHYYEEALQLYLKKPGKDADPEKVAMLEKNIGLALSTRGQYKEAVKHLDKALSHYWGALPKNMISTLFRFLSAFFHLIVSLYFPSLKSNRIPTQDVPEHIDLYNKKCEVLTLIDPKSFFLEYLSLFKEVTHYDLARLELGPKIFVGVSTLFSFTGISFRLSRKVLDSAKNWIPKDNPKIGISYDLMETIHNYLVGNWKEINKYDGDLVDKNLRIGEFYSASQHLFWHGLPNIYQGCFKIAKDEIIERLKDIFKVYEYDVSIMLKQLLNTNLLMEYRKVSDADTEIEKGIEFAQKTNYGLFLIHLFSCKARLQLLKGDIEEAEKSLEHADKFNREVHSESLQSGNRLLNLIFNKFFDLVVPWQLSNLRKTRLEYDLYRFEESIRDDNRKKLFGYQKKAFKSGSMLLKQSQKVAQHRTESLRLMGVYYWLSKNQRTALMWWDRSIKEGERLGARLELSRTYFEVGKRLIEPESKYKEHNGIKAEEYLDLAKALFAELDLQWDLGELGRVAKG